MKTTKRMYLENALSEARKAGYLTVEQLAYLYEAIAEKQRNNKKQAIVYPLEMAI